jgi:GNAT superfamily N-acetyltransferase
MGSPHVRRAVAGDAHALAVIHVETWRAAYAGLMPEAVLAAQSIPDRERAWRERLSRPPSPDPRTWVVEIDGRLLGFASTGPARDADATPADTELYALYLDASAWGTGLGRLLFAHAVEDVAARGYTAMTLWVLDGNARARRFYEAAGMRDDGGRKIEEEGGASLPHMRYRLPLGPFVR